MVQFDFADSAKPGALEDVYKEIADLDVSILVNNVGTTRPIPLVKQTMENIWNGSVVNCLP